MVSSEVRSTHYDPIVGYSDQPTPVSIPSNTFPQQSLLQCDQSHLSIGDDFDDYSFAPSPYPSIIRTNSFEFNNSTEVWYTPISNEATANGLVQDKTKFHADSAPTLSKTLDSPVDFSVSHSAPTSPSFPTTTWRTRCNLPKLNLPFKLKGFTNGSKVKCFSVFDAKKTATSKLRISDESRIVSVQNELMSHIDRSNSPSCNSVTETESTEYRDNRTTELVDGKLDLNANMDDSFESCDEILLNPISHPSERDVPVPFISICGEEVELICGTMDLPIKQEEFEAHNFEEECDVYFTGGSLDTIQSACGELARSFEGSKNKDITPTKASIDLASPTHTMKTSGSYSFSSTFSIPTSCSSSIVKPPNHSMGYDPFGVHSDFDTGIEVEFSESDDSTLSIEYAMRYCGLKSGLDD